MVQTELDRIRNRILHLKISSVFYSEVCIPDIYVKNVKINLLNRCSVNPILGLKGFWVVFPTAVFDWQLYLLIIVKIL